MRFLRSLALGLLALLPLPALAANNCTVSGTITYSAGKFGNAASGFSNSNYCTLPNTLSGLSTSTGYTIEGWLWGATSTSVQVAGLVGSSTSTWIGVDNVGNITAAVYGLNGNNPFTPATGTAASSTTPIHVELDVNSSGAVLYVNGSAVQTVTGTATAPDAGGQIGSFGGGNFPFTGKIDQFTVWPTVRHTANFTPPTSAYTGSEGMTALYALDSNGNDTATGGPAPTFIAPNNAAIYQPGGFLVSSTNAITNNPGNYLRMGFTGTSLTLSYDGSASTTGVFPRVAAYIDGVDTGILPLTGSATGTLQLASGLRSGKHTVELYCVAVDQAQDRYNVPSGKSTPSAVCNFTGFTLDAGASAYALPHKAKLIVGDGDSITECYNGLDNTGNEATAQDGRCSYIAQLRKLDAEVVIVGYAGQGLMQPVGAPQNIPALTTTYSNFWAGQPRTFATAPDLFLIAMGQNDGPNADADISAALVQVANGLHTAYPTAQVAALSALAGTKASAVLATASTVTGSWYHVKSTTSPTAWWPTAGTTTDSPDGYHPYNYAHQYIIAPNLLSYVQSLLYPASTTIPGRSNLFQSFNAGTVADGGSTGTTSATYPSGLPLQLFGASYPLNQPIDTLPVDTRQALFAETATPPGQPAIPPVQDTVDNAVRVSYLGSSDRTPYLDPEFGVTPIHSLQHPECFVRVIYRLNQAYWDESDSIDPTQTGPNGEHVSKLVPMGCGAIEEGPDKHLLVYDYDTRPGFSSGIEYEGWHTERNSDGSITVDQLSQFDITNGHRVSDNGCNETDHRCTSADAAGLPIVAGLVRFEEVQYAIDHNLPTINHAIRFTTNKSRTGPGGHNGWFIGPGTHAAGNQGYAPFIMGMRMRIPSSMTMPTGMSPVDQVIWRTLQKFGQINADNGGTGFLTGDDDSRWNGWHDFRFIGGGLHLVDMEVVNTGCWLTNDGPDSNTGMITPCTQ